MRVAYLRALLLTVIALSASCNLLTPLVFLGEHTKKVLPEFDKLPNSKVAILVWTEPATLFDYPHARFELATYVADKLTTEMGQRKLGTELVDPRDVEEFLQRNVDAQIDPAAVGRQFRADYVVYLEVLAFQIRNPDQPQFLQGRIEASVSVHHIRADPNQPTRFELTPVKTEYPKGAPVLLSASNSPLVREQVYRMFAEEVARKFHEYNVDM